MAPPVKRAAADPSPTPTRAEPLGRQINVAAHATRGFLDATLAEAGMTFANWSVLAALSETGPLIQRDLARHLGMIGPSLVDRIDQLEAAGLVRRMPVPEDRRATRIEVTEAGHARFDDVAGVMRATERALTDGLSADEVATARRVLAHIASRARALRAERGA